MAGIVSVPVLTLGCLHIQCNLLSLCAPSGTPPKLQPWDPPVTTQEPTGNHIQHWTKLPSSALFPSFIGWWQHNSSSSLSQNSLAVDSLFPQPTSNPPGSAVCFPFEITQNATPRDLCCLTLTRALRVPSDRFLQPLHTIGHPSRAARAVLSESGTAHRIPDWIPFSLRSLSPQKRLIRHKLQTLLSLLLTDLFYKARSEWTPNAPRCQCSKHS